MTTLHRACQAAGAASTTVTESKCGGKALEEKVMLASSLAIILYSLSRSHRASSYTEQANGS